ncbi:MAG: hypothetical protein EXQ85_03140 [Alphaproteobacteria bacterium]|nr:hypothetical protein [Alphaproteobacteria bacterium]
MSSSEATEHPGSKLAKQERPLASGADFVSPLQLLRQIWGGKWVMLIVFICSIACAAWILKHSVPLYVATLTIGPAGPLPLSSSPTRNANNESVLAAVLSGGGSRALSPFLLLTETLGSVTLAERLQGKYALLQVFYRDEWDPASQTWHEPPGINDTFDARLNRFFGLPVWTAPSSIRLAEHLKGSIKIIATRGGLTQLEYLHRDPQFAAQLLQRVFGEADDLIRSQERAKTLANLDYIKRQLDIITAREHRDALTVTLVQLERNMMSIESTLPFAATVMDGPVAGENPISPNLRRTFAIAAAVGLLAGAALAWLWSIVPLPWRR